MKLGEPMTKKTVEHLLEEQNALISKQNELLSQQVVAANNASFRADINGAADRWDKANPIKKFFFINPIQRR